MGKTNTKIKRFVSLLVSCVMLLSVIPSVFANPAETFSDFPTGWSRPAMEAAVDNGLLVGVGGGKIGPQKYLTRAEMAAVMVRAFGATTYADISMYKDLDPNSWYYNEISRAVQMEAITGVSATEMVPEDYITREQVFSILSRILALSSNNTAALAKFKDNGNVSAWALNTVIPLVERGYVNGDNNGYLNPKSYITREEFAQLMYSTIRRYITAPGTYSEDMEGMVVLRCGNVTLKDMYIEGDLVIGDGVNRTSVNYDGVTVNGRLLTRGGIHTVKNTVIKYGVVVLNPNGVTVFRNFKTEAPFAGIIEYTMATFLTNTGSSSGIGGGSQTDKHTVTFKLFESDTDEYDEIRVAHGKKIGSKMPDDPEASDIPGYTFNGWVDENDDPVTEDTRVYDDMLVIADLSPIGSTITVTFFEGYGDYAPEIDEVELTLNSDGEATVDVADIPDISTYSWVAYEKSDYMPATYDDYDGIVRVTPTFWYNNGTEWLAFDENVVLTSNTTVHLFYKQLELAGFDAAVSTRYGTGTRIIDSVISLSNSAYAQLDDAKNTGLSLYEKIDDTVFGIMEDKDLINNQRYIKKIDLDLPFSKVTTKAIANGMVKKYVRQMIADPAKLDQLLNMVDINDLVSYIDKNAFISSLTDAQIVQIVTKPENRDTVVDFVMADLHNSESALIETVIDYVSDALTTDANLRNAVAEELKDIIAGNDTTAKNLRKLILKSDSLDSILANNDIKEEVIELIIDVDNGVLDAIINNSDNALKRDIIEEISHYPTFITEIVRTSSFKDYALGLIRRGGTEYNDVSLKILNSNTAKRQILDEVENSAELKHLLKNDAAIRADIINSIVVNENELLKYVFNIDGANDYSDVISETDIESYFETIPGYSACTTPDLKKQFKNNIYADPAARDEALAELQTKITEYKNKVLDDFADGTLTDTDIIEVIEDKMIDYVRKYIDKETINSDLEEIIEDHILDYVADIIVNPAPADTVLAEVKTSLDADMDEFIATAHENDTVMTAIKNFVKNHHDDEMKVHIRNIYNDITPVLINYIKTIDETSEVYANIDGALQATAPSIPTSVIAEIIEDKSDDPEVLKLLKAYIQDEDNADVIDDYVDDFIDTIDEDFVAANRTVINSMLHNLDIDGFVSSNPSDALQFVKDHIESLNDNEKIVFADDIYNMVSATTEYKDMMDDLFVNDELEITPEKITILKVLSLTIRDLEMDDALSFTHNSQISKLVDFIGRDYIENQYEIVRDNYCDGLDEKIELVENGTSARETYTTSLIFVLDPMDVLVTVYDKAQNKVINKLENMNIHYNENPYLQYLAEQNIIDKLFIDTGVTTDELTAYKLRDITDYVAYMVELEIAVNDALLWYGDELTDAQFDAICDAVFAKLYAASDRIDNILTDFADNGELPSKLETAITSIEKINNIYLKFEPKLKSIVEKYLNSSIHDDIENGTLDDNDKLQSAIDILIGKDDPVFTIDSLFDIFYNYDDKMQEKLQTLIDLGKFDTAIEKFRNSAAGQKLGDDAIDDIIDIVENVAEHGVEYYQVTSSDIKVIEKYEITVGSKTFTLVRSFMF